MSFITTDESILRRTCSYWISSTEQTGFPSLYEFLAVSPGEVLVDTVIVGGGIVGLSAASLLKDAGQKVAVLDMGRIVEGVTGHTTAKITSLHGLIYHELVEKHGEDKAQSYGEANQAALNKITRIIERKKIDCDLKRTAAYTYTENDESVKTIQKEADIAARLGLPASFTKETPLPFDIKGAVRFDEQAQFHPRKYLLSLALGIPGEGSHIFENTKVLSIKENDRCEVLTNNGKIYAKNVVIATHFPFYDKGFFYARLEPHYSYAAAMAIEGKVPEGMYLSFDGNHHSIRNQPYDGGDLLIVGGGHHKTGQGGDTIRHYREMIEYANERFDVKSIDYHWSTEDYQSIDLLPFIGKSPAAKNVYIAAGFAAWGMTNGTLSAMIISDLILGNKNKWAGLFDPSRINLGISATRLVAQNVNVMRAYTRGRLSKPEPGKLSSLKKGEGKIMNIDDKRVAVYRDEDDKIYVMSPLCPHMRCVVAWNNAERTWDCPCHGSRFKFDGRLIHGPALADLMPE